MTIPRDWQQGAAPPAAPAAPPTGAGGPAPATQAIPADWQKQVAPTSPAPPAAPVAATGASERKPLDYLLAGAGLLAFIASFLPWASISFGPVSNSVAGTDGGRDGIITVVLGLVLLALGILRLSKGPLDGVPKIVAALAAVGVLAVGLYDFVDVRGSGAELQQEVTGDGDVGGFFDVSVSVGIGLYLVVLAGIAAVAGVVLAGRRPAS